MKRIKFIFAALALTAGIAVISCSKESAPTSPEITSATDAVQVDNSVNEITGIIDDYQSLNGTNFTDPTLKAAAANHPMSIPFKGLRRDTCANVSMTYIANALTGVDISFTIDFGTTGCTGFDKKIRTGTISSTYTWVRLGGWSRVSAINLTTDGVQYVGTQTLTFGVTGANNHALFTEHTALKVTAKDASWKNLESNRQRELMEGNGGVNPVKIFKITGNSTFSNSALESSSYTISPDTPLMKHSDCKTFSSGIVTIVNKAGVITTIDYGTGVTCPDGFTIKTHGDKNGKGIITRFIKFINR